MVNRSVTTIAKRGLLVIDCPMDRAEAGSCGALSREACHRAAAYGSPRDARYFVNGRRWVISVLSKLVGGPVRLTDRSGGAPTASVYGAPIPLHYSFSRAERHGLLVVSAGGPVAIDAEAAGIAGALDESIERFYDTGTRKRISVLSGRAREKARLDEWLRLEARLKLSGYGVAALDEKRSVPPAPYERMIEWPRGIRVALAATWPIIGIRTMTADAFMGGQRASMEQELEQAA